MHQLNIGFHGKSLVIQSDSSFILSYLRHRFKRLIVNSDQNSVKSITLPRFDAGLDLDSPEHGGLTWKKLRLLEYEIMDTLINATGEYLWFHAGATAKAGRAVLFAGKSGCGKSTLSLGLCALGSSWRFLGDDAIPFLSESQSAYAFPRTPWYRQGNGQELAPERLWELKKQDVEVDAGMIWHGPARLGMVILPLFKHGASLNVKRVRGMPVAWDLINCSFNMPAHGVAALKFASDVAQNIPSYRIEYSSSQDAIQRVNELWEQSYPHQDHVCPVDQAYCDSV